MISSKLMALTVAGLLSVGSSMTFAQSSGSGSPVDKGGMPPSTEMNAGQSGPENALPPGSIGGGNGGDADGSSTSPGKGSGSMSGGSSTQSDSGRGSGESGSSGAAADEEAGG
nr:hypothetical protein [Pseudomonas sp. P1.8]